MFGFLNHSLLLRAGLAMGVVTVLAVAGMASAVYVARSTHGEAAAVNLAGSLRMQCYRIAASLEAGDRTGDGFTERLAGQTRAFASRLRNPALTKVVTHADRRSLQLAYTRIAQRWHDQILPLSLEYARLIEEGDSPRLTRMRQHYREQVEGYVEEIDRLVLLLEEDAESRIHQLGLMQGINLMLTLTVAIITLYLLHTDVISPLRDMLGAAERAGQGDFNARVALTGDDELGRLGQAFNTMTGDLSKLYGDLESRVAEKTDELTQRNRSLELLYNASRYLTEAPLAETTYRAMLEEISQLLGGGGITLCLHDDTRNRTYRTACYGEPPPMCESGSCAICIGDGRTRLLSHSEHGSDQRILSVAVRDQESDYGVLLIEQPDDQPLLPWQIKLLETLGKQIGISVGVTRRVIQHRRLALLDERSVIARELHDSLAQSLSYLKIQVTRLTLLRNSHADEQAVDDVLTELKEGLSAAYRQLRELLTTFRLQMDGRGLSAALEQTVAEFNGRGEVSIDLDNHIDARRFSVNEEIHVLQIIREALSNLVYHSGARQARVRLADRAGECVQVSIEDDGVGIPSEAERTHHYGLAIMRERASSLNGQLSITSLASGGTRVCLQFHPTGRINRQQESELS